MDQIEALRLAGEEFRRRLLGVAVDQHFLATPCEGWNVNELVSHVLGGNRMAVRLLEGARRPEATGYLAGLPLGEDPVESFDEGLAAMLMRFSEPGAFERVCEHPMGDLPGAAVADLRIGDLTIHSWDLAVAVGGDTDLDGALVERIWDGLEQRRDEIVVTGVFGRGPSGEVTEAAPLQVRLLDLLGRRPSNAGEPGADRPGR